MREPKRKYEVFMRMAMDLAELSKDPSTQHGALIVDQRNIIVSQGYNGPPRRIPDTAVNWNRDVTQSDAMTKYDYVKHAEDNAIYFGVAARGLLGLEGCTLYCTGKPCSRCMLDIVRAGIAVVIYGDRDSKCVDMKDWQKSIRLANLSGVILSPLLLPQGEYQWSKQKQQ
jgi:deoxycytidylate deaminase